MNEAKRQLIRSWLIKAQHDLASADVLSQSNLPLLDTAIYHCQQTAEKSVRAYPFEILSLSLEDGGGYLVTFPDLPGCVSDGDTLEEALHNGLDATESWLRTAAEFGDSLPDPVAAE